MDMWRAMLLGMGILTVILVHGAAQQRKEIGSGEKPESGLQLKPLPKGISLQPVPIAQGGDFSPAQTDVKALLYESAGGTGYFLGTSWEVNENVPLLGRACIRRVAIGYWAEDVDGNGTASNVINLTVTFRRWDGIECSPPRELLTSVTLTNLPDNGGWLVSFTLNPPVVVEGNVYVGTAWNHGGGSDQVGWIVVEGRPGNGLYDRSPNSFWVHTLNGCYWFGGSPPGNFALWLYGSYNTAFRIPLDDPTTVLAMGTIRATFDTGSGGYWHYPLTRAPDEPTLWFSVPMSTAEGGNHTIYVNMLPFIPFQRDFQVTSDDPCNPTVVDIQLISGDLNGDGCIDDFDLLSILFNFGTGC
jgi:hypothetical protein